MATKRQALGAFGEQLVSPGIVGNHAHETRLTDLALLCANCHRLIHRVIAVRKEWVTIMACREIPQLPFVSFSQT